MEINHRGAQRLVQQLRAKGIKDDRVLKSFAEVSRELFVPSGLSHRAYSDSALPITGGQTISAPSTVAAMLQVLHLGPRDRVLEVGTGSGFQTALLTKIVADVYTIERNLKLVGEVKDRLIKAGCGTAHLRAGDGLKGWAEHSPYDAIIVSAGTDKLPVQLLDQLKTGGRMVIPLKGKITLVVKSRNGLRTRQLTDCQFVPLIPGYTP
ncbi:protein-L-isoaspartate(D-aspartate) O-methyltransferase [candidate division WOR-3 bacterium]|nr:protein-L-isoaspartate(D-aspartate) O-methyltransferase [candidate division WOR-3 bacterium]